MELSLPEQNKERGAAAPGGEYIAQVPTESSVTHIWMSVTIGLSSCIPQNSWAVALTPPAAQTVSSLSIRADIIS